MGYSRPRGTAKIIHFLATAVSEARWIVGLLQLKKKFVSHQKKIEVQKASSLFVCSKMSQWPFGLASETVLSGPWGMKGLFGPSVKIGTHSHSKLRTCNSKKVHGIWIFNKPGVARAVLKTPLSHIDWLSDWLSDPFPPNLQDIINPKPLELGSWNFHPHHLSHVTCHVSHVRCHKPGVMYHHLTHPV